MKFYLVWNQEVGVASILNFLLKADFNQNLETKLNLDETLAVRGILQITGINNAVLHPCLVIVGVCLHAHAESIGLEASPVGRIT